MIILKLRKRYSVQISRVLFVSLLYQLIYPVSTFALTSGPSQPEMQSFEPVGTTDMVDLFSGDFNYNIPLLDVEGYPINIAYHSGMGMEQEASWVGLGWNINPGNINHVIRGISDDNDGEFMEKEIDINPEKKKRYQFGLGAEYAGFGGNLTDKLGKAIKVSGGGSINFGITISNYSGVSADLKMGTSSSISNSWFSAGMNMGATINTASGVDVDYNFSAGVKTTGVVSTAVNGSFGQGYNSREGLKYTSFGVNPSVSLPRSFSAQPSKDGQKNNGSVPAGLNTSFVPIALQNFVPVITNASFMNSTFTQVKFGAEIYSILPHITGAIGEDKIEFEKNGSVKSYGYLNMQHANKDDMVDFTRDRDGRYNRMMRNLPPASMTYDIFAVNGQGTAGNFRPFRNDIGYVFDPLISSDSKAISSMLEVGVGNIAEAGWDRVKSTSTSTSRPWEAFFTNNTDYSGFQPRRKNDIFEPYYFKQAGELTEANQGFKTNIAGYNPLPSVLVPAVAQSNPNLERTKRSNLFYYFNGEEASNPNTSLHPKIETYTTQGYPSTPVKLLRVKDYRHANHISEITQLLPDGRRYIFGIPAMNKSQYEYVVSCDAPQVNDGLVTCTTDAVNGMPNFGQKFKMTTKTPPFAHSYLLTDILSADYSDLTGDGISDDDLGSYTKFNYTLKDTNYKWRTPYLKPQGGQPLAQGPGQYDAGVKSDCHDDKATFILGSKEIWILHSVESKNFVAEFYTSPRADGLGADGQNIVLGNSINKSYKLDSIVLFNKMDRKVNTSNAVPIKKVIFSYDYSLCPGTENTESNLGKLTLKAISIKYGKSDVGLLSPYKFEYDNLNPQYNQTCKDMWGNYKPASSNNIGGNSHLALSLTNHEFPYINQTDPNLEAYASAWNLKKIFLPSGGTINVSYEPDDYAKVQDKNAMEMFQVKGVGLSTDFVQNNTLYQSPTSPYLYIYFKRRINEELYPNDIAKSYLGVNNILQYNFEVEITQDQTTESCGLPLKDNIKGYATIDGSGICTGNGNTGYGYIKLKPKTASTTAQLKTLKIGDIKINPITLTAINYAKYYNNKSLYPSSEMVNAGAGDVIKNLLQTGTEITDYVINPLRKFIKEGKAKNFDISKSYIRLNSQLKKFGGGHRVKRIEFIDSWNGIANVADASYGSDYEYTMLDIASNKIISSGVASYEPLLGGNENPFKAPLSVDLIGNNKKFPVTDPIELTNEGPIGETMYPSATVGYSKVTVKSIHKNVGESSQLVQEHEFYTANDFPVKVKESAIEVLEDVKPKKLSFKAKKKEAYRVAQGYTLEFNDMHGKPKMQKSINKNGQCVSYKKYEYFCDNDKTLNNNVKCLAFDPINFVEQTIPHIVTKELGVEVDFTLDSREREEKSDTKGYCVNLNTFLIGPVPVPLPSGFPKRPKSLTKIFSSIVNTKVVQRYGILKSVETFDKGATVKLSNDVFDPSTGQVLITHVNTEHNDVEYNTKYPAYWAYTGMGPAYENIQYEEIIDKNASIVNDTMYIYPTVANDQLKNYRIGDELVVDIKNSCKTNDANNKTESYKLWVVGKTDGKTPNVIPSVVDECFPITPYCLTPNANQYPNNSPFGTEQMGYEWKLNCDIGPNISEGDETKHHNCGSIETFVRTLRWWVRDLAIYDTIAGSPNGPVYYYGKLKFPIEFMDVEIMRKEDKSKIIQYCSGNYSTIATFANATCGCYKSFWLGYDRHNNAGQHVNNLNQPENPREINFTYKAIRNGNYFNNYGNLFNNVQMPLIHSSTNVLKVEYEFKQTASLYNNTVPSSNNQDVNGLGQPYNLAELGPTGTIDNNTISGYNWVTDIYQNEPAYKITVYFPFENGATAPESNLFSSVSVPAAFPTANIACGVYNPDFPAGLTPSQDCIDNLKLGYVSKFHISRVTATVVPRERAYTSYNNKSALICLPQKRQAKSTTGTYAVFPTDDSIIAANVKIIRSGNRNQISESAQELVSLNNPIVGNQLSNSISKTISASARTYTDKAYAPAELGDADTKYNNPIVTGLMWNFRPLQEYVFHTARDYTQNIDKNKGTFTWTSFFTFISKSLHTYLNHASASGNGNGWYSKTNVDIYNPWGNDLQVKDASGNFHSNIFGYGNKLPVAIVTNSKWNNSVCENFEDCTAEENRFIKDLSYTPDFFVKSFQNTLKEKVVVDNTNFEIVSSNKHSGTKSLEIKSNAATVDFSVKDDAVIINANNYQILDPFYFRPQQKYIISFWKKVVGNQVPGQFSGIHLLMGGSNFQFKLKTPEIGGWAKYEGEFTVPTGITTAQMTFPDNAFFDDFRIIPFSANMKSYVYHPVNRRLVAVLDENNMSTIFEYNPEGKLARIKKETEKGVLTLKESREALRHIIAAPGNVNLVDVNAYVPTGTIPTVPYTGYGNQVNGYAEPNNNNQ